MTAPYLRVVGRPPHPDPSFFLIVTHHDQVSVEGPMTDDQPSQNAARHARDQLNRRVVCGPAGPDQNTLAAEFQRAGKLAGVPPGRPRQ
jgi:hypothetical protein